VVAYACLVAVMAQGPGAHVGIEAPDLTRQVSTYIQAADIAVADSISLSVDDNCAVGRLDPLTLLDYGTRLDTTEIDGIVLSACVQMSSVPAVPMVEQALGLPVVTAATATAREILLGLGLEPVLPDAGAALAGALTVRAAQ
jgi:maleate isomerase